MQNKCFQLLMKTFSKRWTLQFLDATWFFLKLISRFLKCYLELYLKLLTIFNNMTTSVLKINLFSSASFRYKRKAIKIFCDNWATLFFIKLIVTLRIFQLPSCCFLTNKHFEGGPYFTLSLQCVQCLYQSSKIVYHTW